LKKSERYLKRRIFVLRAAMVKDYAASATIYALAPNRQENLVPRKKERNETPSKQRFLPVFFQDCWILCI